ncbi:aldehyde dehydrogenase family protein [Paraburkholderia fungorum]|uniref:Aldehyde dehydrogenase family protein n=1 Tax=Paraburkholderia fungorum TaxID=134537 RepID=A0AAU8TEZ0_9BURK|nr:aldehyde dehydrogenase family protein [Paraburkholderia fungorum]AJZ58895.1 aldehyde dehydrogenase family protein [Paraburkholderia fungorum]
MSLSALQRNQARLEELAGRPWKLLIGGELTAAQGGKVYATISPSTGKTLADVPFAQATDVNSAVEAAERAFPAWRDTPVVERVAMLRKLIAALKENAYDLALLDAADLGSPITAMQGDVRLACILLEYICNAASEVKGQSIPGVGNNWHITRREPYGVVGRIIPFNHPLMFAASKIGAPLVMGNTVVLKVPDQTPLSPLYLGTLIKDIFPPGVINILSGDGQTTGDTLVRHPRVKRIALTGSVETGQLIQRSAAEVMIKHVSLELGGKNPMIVFPDADIDKAVEGAATGMNFHWSQGQSCGSTTRLFLHKDIHDEFVEKLKQRVERIRIGNPLDPETEMGCVVSKAQYDKVHLYIGLGKEQGAQCVTGGGKPDGDQFAEGLYVRPTIFTGVSNDYRIAQEEIFGPILSVLKWDDEEDVIRSANRIEYGLTAAVWTRDINKAFKAINRLEAGFTWINGSSTHFVGVPFGGYKNSGVDNEEGIEELYSYTQLKAVNIVIA